MEKKALIVIDDAVTAENILPILQNNGYDTKELRSTDRVLEITKDFNPHIIIISVTLNATDGHYLCKTIKQKNTVPGTPILLIKQATDNDYLIDKQHGPDGFIETPFYIDAILEKLEEHTAV
jgi:OmpR family two-component system response regulator YxdJ